MTFHFGSFPIPAQKKETGKQFPVSCLIIWQRLLAPAERVDDVLRPADADGRVLRIGPGHLRPNLVLERAELADRRISLPAVSRGDRRFEGRDQRTLVIARGG